MPSDSYITNQKLQPYSASKTVRGVGISSTYTLMYSSAKSGLYALKRVDWNASTNTLTETIFPWFNTPTISLSKFPIWYMNDYGADKFIDALDEFLAEHNSILQTDIETVCTWFYQDDV